MIWLLAQLEGLNREEALKKGWWNLSFILLVGAIAVLFLIAMILLRRWKHKQLTAIEQDRAERRAGMPAERVDAWAASAQRYVDHDKLSPDDQYGRQDEREGDQGDEDTPQSPEEDDHDPFGLFSDKPYQEADDDFDDDEEDDGDWDEEDEDDKR